MQCHHFKFPLGDVISEQSRWYFIVSCDQAWQLRNVVQGATRNDAKRMVVGEQEVMHPRLILWLKIANRNGCWCVVEVLEIRLCWFLIRHQFLLTQRQFPFRKYS